MSSFGLIEKIWSCLIFIKLYQDLFSITADVRNTFGSFKKKKFQEISKLKNLLKNEMINFLNGIFNYGSLCL